MRNNRRLQRDMSRSRQALNRKPLPEPAPGDVDDGPRPAAPMPRAQPFEHPAIVPAHPNWYRVMRVSLTGPAECIAEFPTLSMSIVCATNEKWRAVVQDRHGRNHFNSWREMKP